MTGAARIGLLLYVLTPMLFAAMVAATVATFEGYRLSDPRLVRLALAAAIGLFGIVAAIVVTTDATYLDRMAAWFASRPPCPRPGPGEYSLCARD